MSTRSSNTADEPQTLTFYHGTRAELLPGDLIQPSSCSDADEQNGLPAFAVKKVF